MRSSGILTAWSGPSCSLPFDPAVNKDLILNSFVRNLKALVDNRKRLAQLLIVNAERRVSEESVPADESIETLLAEETPQSSHLFRSSVERSHGLACLAAANEFEDAEQSDRSHGPD